MSPDNRRAVGAGALVAASWANVALLPTWLGLFDPTAVSARGGQLSSETYWTTVLVVLIAAVIGALAMGMRCKVSRRVWLLIGDIALLAALLSLCLMLWRVNGGKLTTVYSVLRSLGTNERLWAGVASLLGGLLVLRHWRTCMQAGRQFLLVLSPFLVVTLGRASFAMSRADLAELDRTVLSRGIAVPRAGPRVIIIVFDELDYSFAFSDRPAQVHLPAFDQLRSESVFATDVSSPAAGTGISLPSYILGQPVIDVAWQRAHSEGFVFRGRLAPIDISVESTMFHDAARLGAPSELVGFYLPYCRWSFAALLERCTWRPMTWGGVFDGRVGIRSSLVRQVLALFVVGNRTAHIARIEQLTAAGLRAVSDSSRRFVFLHLPIPHFPPVWNARHGRYTLVKVSLSAYFDNLALADGILARFRAAIDRGATAEPTFLIVTSDHPWSSGSINGRIGGKIPFIVRTPSAQRIGVPGHVDAVRLRALTVRLLSGELTTARDVAAWLASPEPD